MCRAAVDIDVKIEELWCSRVRGVTDLSLPLTRRETTTTTRRTQPRLATRPAQSSSTPLRCEAWNTCTVHRLESLVWRLGLPGTSGCAPC